MSLHVEDLHETTAFYCEAFGFELDNYPSPIGTAAVRLGASLLHFTETARLAKLALDDVEAPPAGLPQGAEIVLSVGSDDFEHTVARALTAGALLVRRPCMLQETREAFFRDPNGALVRLVGASGSIG